MKPKALQISDDSFSVLLPVAFFCCSVHVTRSARFQQINFSVAIRNFSISVNFKQPSTSGVTDFGKAPKLLVSVVWGINLSGLG